MDRDINFRIVAEHPFAKGPTITNHHPTEPTDTDHTERLAGQGVTAEAFAFPTPLLNCRERRRNPARQVEEEGESQFRRAGDGIQKFFLAPERQNGNPLHFRHRQIQMVQAGGGGSQHFQFFSASERRLVKAQAETTEHGVAVGEHARQLVLSRSPVNHLAKRRERPARRLGEIGDGHQNLHQLHPNV